LPPFLLLPPCRLREEEEVEEEVEEEEEEEEEEEVEEEEEKEKREGGGRVCVIFRRITRRGRVGTLASIYGGWEGAAPPDYIYAPIGLNISRFCAPSTFPRFRPSVFSILPHAALCSPPMRVAPFCDCVSYVFVSVRSCALLDMSASSNKNYYFPRPTNASLETCPSNSLSTMRDFRKERTSYVLNAYFTID